MSARLLMSQPVTEEAFARNVKAKAASPQPRSRRVASAGQAAVSTPAAEKIR